MDELDHGSSAQVLWDYHQLRMSSRSADAIMVLCSHDTRVAERGAELFLRGDGRRC